VPTASIAKIRQRGVVDQSDMLFGKSAVGHRENLGSA
jgi:hypothetical protein